MNENDCIIDSESEEENMIYTVTFNPSLDYIITVDDFRMGKTNRTTTEQMLREVRESMYPQYCKIWEWKIQRLDFWPVL